MAVHLPTPGSDVKIWGLPLNDSFNPLMGNDQLIIALNGNNPPTVKAGTSFYVYKTSTYLTPNVTTGNNVYPGNTTCTFLVSEAINEPADQTFTFGSGGFPSKVNSTLYYLYCTGALDTDQNSRLKGDYGATTSTPTYDNIKKGWYDTNGYRHIGMFWVDSSGNVKDAIPMPSKLVAYSFLTANGTTMQATYNPAENNQAWDIDARLVPATTTTSIVQWTQNGNTTSGAFGVCVTRLLTETSTTVSTAVSVGGVTIANTPSGSSESLMINGYMIKGIGATGNDVTTHLTTTILSSGGVRYTADTYQVGSGGAAITNPRILTAQNMAPRSFLLIYKR